MDPQPEGYSLGGQSGDRPLTADELREKRLSRLSSGGVAPTTGVVAAPPPVAATSPKPAPIEIEQVVEDVKAIVADDDEVMVDEELQAALALSMQKDTTEDSPMKDAPVSDGTVTTPTAASDVVADATAAVPTNLQTRFAAGAPSTDSLDISEFHTIMWDSKVTTDNDKDRWVGQGISVRTEDIPPVAAATTSDSRLSLIGSSYLPWGLTQAHGGPCGVMAAAQAELLRILLFGSKGSSLSYPTVLLDDDEKKQESSVSPLQPVRQGLAMAIAIIVARAALMPDASSGAELTEEAKIVLPATIVPQDAGLVWKDLEPWNSVANSGVKSDLFVVHTLTASATGDDNSAAKRQRTSGSSSPVPFQRQDRILDLAHTISSFLQEPNILECFQKAGGVVLLVMSLVASRGGKTISQDMDDDTCKLTSQFGHCSQELINLLLTGQAVSNVFDNTMTPSGSLTCRGIQQRPAVGYLTQLESLRYCEVGGYYKNPRFPIWVVGSTSHFTVLFGDSSCLKESKSDALLEKCRRAFKEVDGVENGFISRMDLPKVYEILKLNVGSEHALQTLAASLEVSGADIILWDDFWKATSRLMTGATIEAVLQGKEDSGPPALLHITNDSGPPPPPPAAATAASPPKIETDEEMAQRLAKEWGPDDWNMPAAAVAPAAAATPAASGPMSDEEYARSLQAQFDSEAGGGGGNSVSAISGEDDNATQQAVADDVTTATIEEDEKMLDAAHEVVDLTGGGPSASNNAPDFEKFGDTFSLYHYNGLRGGTLTPFRVTRLTAEEAVGASIALGASSGGAGGAAAGGDLEDVVRTKWPSCMMNWLGKSPPYID
jgi:hypothetical protein